MPKKVIEVNGFKVDLLSKSDIRETLVQMNTEAASRIKRGSVKTHSKRVAEIKTLAFFGSIAHHLEEDMEG